VRKKMCRLLFVKSNDRVNLKQHLEFFAAICRNSREYQGHGWGLAFIRDGKWKIYRSILPIWEDDLSVFGSSSYIIAHARSAFRDEDIDVKNNMPFYYKRHVFIFNGELRGVRLRSEGRTGAEKLFHFIKRLDRGDILEAMNRGVELIQRRSEFIRGMNFIIGDGKRIYLNSFFSEDEEYFTMHLRRENGALIVCSEPYPGQGKWHKINNHTMEVME